MWRPSRHCWCSLLRLPMSGPFSPRSRPGRRRAARVILPDPEPQDLVDMARRALAARGESIRLVPSWRGGPFSVEMAGEVLLPGPDTRLAPTTFDAWLAQPVLA